MLKAPGITLKRSWQYNNHIRHAPFFYNPPKDNNNQIFFKGVELENKTHTLNEYTTIFQ